MSETKRINWTSDESVVRAYESGVYQTKDGHIWIANKINGMPLHFGAGWSESRKHPSVVTLDEAHRKVMEHEPTAQAVMMNSTGRWFIADITIGGISDYCDMEAAAWISAASKLEGPSVQGERTVIAGSPEWVAQQVMERPATAPREEEGAAEAECWCDEYGTDLCSIHRTHCKECGKPLAAPVVEEAPRRREGFDPEKVIRADTDFPDANGKWWQASCVEAEDFDALMAMYKSLRGFSHLEEALDLKVTWRVEQRVGQAPEHEWVRVVVSEDRTIFNPYHSRQHAFRLVKITTTEEVIEVRTKESADGKVS